MHNINEKLDDNLMHTLYDLKSIVKFNTWYEVWTFINGYLENSLDSCFSSGLKHKLKQVSNDASHE